MGFNTRPNLDDIAFKQLPNTTLNLSGNTNVDGGFFIKNIKIDPSVSATTSATTSQVLTKLNDGTIGLAPIQGGDSIYNLSSPSTIGVGGIPINTNILGLSSNQILEKILVPYIAPQFTSFSIQSQNNIIEVGSILSGNKNFIWNISTSSNVNDNLINIRDVNSNLLIGSSITNDGNEILDIGVKSNTVPTIWSWRGEALNTKLESFQSNNFTIESIYPYFYGVIPSGGAVSGENRPTVDNTLISGGTKVVGSSLSTITVTYNSTSDDYIWFAIPSLSTSKTKWYINALNNGDIGGNVSVGGNLFPNSILTNVDSPTVLWNGIAYKIYMSNYQTEMTNPIQLRNN